MAIYMHKDTVHQENLQALKALNPKAACHDGVWFYFIKEIPESDRTYTSVDVTEWDLSGDELVWEFAKLVTNNVDTAVRFDVYTGHAMYQHPAYRIWCANYEGRTQFQSDWIYIKNMIAEKMPEAAPNWPEYSSDLTFEQGREVIFNAIQTVSDMQ